MDTSSTKEKWSKIFCRWEESGESQREFCRTHNISFWSFRNWKAKLKRLPEKTNPFVELSCKDATIPKKEPDFLRIRFPNRIVIETNSRLSREQLELILKVGSAV